MGSMVAAPVAEMSRLAALRSLELLDTEPEPEFDELVQLAAAVCDVPMSVVTLVDENRQWFKAMVGLHVRETPRSVAFCSHAIEQADMLVVEDAELDPRFSRNPLVTGEPNVRFYAGMPIYSPDGFAMGTLCVIDNKPRRLNRGQLSALRVIALQVNTKLELRVQRKQLEAALSQAEQSNAELFAAKADLQEAHERLMQLAVTDSLTGLCNRRAFDERLAVEMTSINRGANLSLLMLDIDHFKKLNDRFGHQAGDEALRKMGGILKRAVRGTDVAARYGGEEFAILLRDATETGAMVLANRILHSVRTADWAHGAITLSVGIAERIKGQPDGKILLARADAALYRAKAAGRDCVRCHHEGD